MSFDELAHHIFAELTEKLPPELTYHHVDHTRRDVLPAARYLCQREEVSESEERLVLAAALFHDVGYLDQYKKNEPFGAARARHELPAWGYSPQEISEICEIIMATEMPQNPKNKLQNIMCDADLGHLGSQLFFSQSEGLRRELIGVGILPPTMTPAKWNEDNLKFLDSHHYWTETAQKEWEPVKRQNMKQIQASLASPSP